MTLVYTKPKYNNINGKNIPGHEEYSIQAKVCLQHPSFFFVSTVQRSENIKSDEKQLIGPGSYCGEIMQQFQKQSASQSMFKSKIDRFKNDLNEKQSQNSKSIITEFYQFRKTQNQDRLKVGKLISFRNNKISKVISNQHLPSIPGLQNSFVYPQNLNTIMVNQNSNLIFVKTPKIVQDNADYFFQRPHVSSTHHGKCKLNLSSKRSPIQITHQLYNPNVMQYHSQKYNCIKMGLTNNKILSVFASKVQRFTQESPSKKEILNLGKIKRYFGKYISTNTNLQQLQELASHKYPQKLLSDSSNIKNKQFFMVKQPRFICTQQLRPLQIKLNQNSSMIKLESNKLCKKGQQIYDRGQKRFKQRHQEHIGPGVYDIPEKDHNSAVLKLNEERFKFNKQNSSSPGPAYYQKDIKLKQRAKYPYHRFRNEAYFQTRKIIDGKFKSMEILYQQLGQSVSCLSEVKDTIKEKHIKLMNIHDSKRDLHISVVQKKIQQKIGPQIVNNTINNEIKLPEVQNQHIQYLHLYNYSKPPEKTNGVGPGHYQVISTFGKKSFNIKALEKQ